MALESADFNELLRDPEEIVASQREQLARVHEMERRIAELTGSATSADKRISVTYSETNGVESITLDPRVMRMPSEDFAAELARVVNAARTDMREQAERVIEETIGNDGRPDLEELAVDVTQIEATMNEFMRDTQAMEGELQNAIERMKQMFRG